MRWHQLRRSTTPLGDYGDVIVHGFCEDGGAELLLMRCGPSCPDVSLPSVWKWPRERIVVTDAVRRELEVAGFADLGWVAVRKARIVKLDWERHLREGRAEYRGEPSSLVMNRKPSGEATQLLPKTWWLRGTERDEAHACLVRKAEAWQQRTLLSPELTQWLAERGAPWVAIR